MSGQREWQVDVELELEPLPPGTRPSQLVVVRELSGMLVGRSQRGWLVSVAVVAASPAEAAAAGLARVRALPEPIQGKVKQVDVVPGEEAAAPPQSGEAVTDAPGRLPLAR